MRGRATPGPGDLAIDLGTANTLVYRLGAGVVLREPTVVAVTGRGGEVLGLGEEVWEMLARAPSEVTSVRPFRDGAVTDYGLTEQLLRLILQRAGATRFRRPRVLLCVPSALGQVERRALVEACRAAGARAVRLLEEPVAAAIGAGLPIHEPLGSLLVDVGGGRTEVAMVSVGGIVEARGVRRGGFDLDADIQRLAREGHGVALGERVAERVKIRVGSAYPVPGLPPYEAEGRELSSGLPRRIRLTQEDVREAMAGTIGAIVEATRACLAESPPELGHDVLERGVFLTGGGALLRGLDQRIAEECEVPVHVADRPLEGVILGAGACLERPDWLSLFAG